MLERIKGVLTLNVNTYEEIEHDPSAIQQAAIIVAIVAVLSGLGAGFQNDNFLAGFLGSFIGTFVGWVIWAWVTLIVGTKVFKGEADMGEMMRVMGYAQAPLMLGVIPILGSFVGGIWSLITGFIAVRQGLDIGNMQTAITIFLGLLFYVLAVAGLIMLVALLMVPVTG